MSDFQATEMDDAGELIPVNPAIEAYMRNLVIRTDQPVLLEMEEFARLRNFPIVNRLVGVFLKTQARMVKAKRIFEFGSGYGYSAYWFAKAVGSNGQIVCSDSDATNHARAKEYLSAVGLWQRIEFHVGLAQDVFVQTGGLFDICYNDVDKGDYPEVWQMAKHRIRSGGLYIADNVLWHGRVAMKARQDTVVESTAAIVEHNQMIFDDPDFDVFINPIRDGVLVARKK
ncbi:O-methyltransferase [Nitrosomonas supralitoralis]|uniref:O-methyltransferase n=1 Tax=Nitrosomonas supralitoralis TaxID=2116706 RepID=A0A2P7NUC7_9PROT|nr:O-methyltransferase [Nitrosomonas supralitoralis]PSJ17073.1 O-methyltransferase [Nitrosomonas supralitoralis]